MAFQRAPFAPAVSLLLMVLVPTVAPFCVYLLLLSTFHLNEYLLTAAFRPDTLNFDNFLLNHSRLYQAMILLSWLEYWLERLLAPGLKQWCPVSSVGLCLSVLGLATRGIAMATASSNFSHMIEEQRREDHMLVTHGIYSVLRHPAYFGYFWWAVGTQVLLANPACLVAYAVATFLFFRNRIPYEERILVRFFGSEYLDYRDRTFIGIPGMALVTRPRPS